MDRFTPRQGTKAPVWRHAIYTQDAVQRTFEAAFADYIQLSQDFFVDGCVLTSTPSGSDIIYTLTDGFACVKGEFMPVVGGTVTKSISQVVFLEVNDDPDDITPVPNLDGQVDYVMRKRTLVLKVGSAYPLDYMVIGAPRKTDLDVLRNKGRLVMRGGIIPYAGEMTNFDATGKGLDGTVMEGWAICNGLNGTIDLRGLVPFGASNVPSSGAAPLYDGVMDATEPGALVGHDKVTLTADQLPAHTHDFQERGFGPGVGGGANWATGGTDVHERTEDRVTAENTPNGAPVDVRQAGMALVYIQSLV